jgi:uncharacterized delta-60 repeat protein
MNPLTDRLNCLTCGPWCRAASLALLLATPLSSQATAPWPDHAFGAGGIVEQSFLGMGGSAEMVFALRDGKTLALGQYVYGRGGRGGIPLSRPVLARYAANGSPDPGFGSIGVLDPSTLNSRLVQRDGKIVGLGQTGLVRLNQDGTPDAGMITDGAAGIAWFADMTPAYLAQQGDGKIAVAGTVGAGTAVLVVARFNTNGSLDTTFNFVGATIVPHAESNNDMGAGLVLQPDGGIVLAARSDVGTAQRIALVRLRTDGTLDTRFGSNGRALAAVEARHQAFPFAVVRQPDGRLVVVGSDYLTNDDYLLSTSALSLTGFTPDGALDASFGSAGTVNFATSSGFGGLYVNAAASQADGKLLVALSSPNVTFPDRVMRFTIDGAADATFGSAGSFVSFGLSSIRAIAIQPDGDLVLGGVSKTGNFAIERNLSGPVAAIEFHHAVLDHYFLSMDPHEIEDLDFNVHQGWQRTGQSLPVFGSLAAATGAAAGVANYPVCRFYIPPQHGDSHFFSVDPVECAAALAKSATDPNFSGYVQETASAFYLGIPNSFTGACPAGTIPVYRLWNRRFDSNHRYTTDPAVKAQMIARGYVSEGSGPEGVAMCAPR